MSRKTFKNSRGIIGHLKSPTHSGTKYRCPYCLRTFNSLAAITSHAEDSSVRCRVRETDTYGALIDQLTGGLADVSVRRHDDGTVKYEVSKNFRRKEPEPSKPKPPKSEPLKTGLFKPQPPKAKEPELVKPEPFKSQPFKPLETELSKSESVKPLKAELLKPESSKLLPVKTTPLRPQPLKTGSYALVPLKPQSVKTEPSKPQLLKTELSKPLPLKAELLKTKQFQPSFEEFEIDPWTGSQITRSSAK